MKSLASTIAPTGLTAATVLARSGIHRGSPDRFAGADWGHCATVWGRSLDPPARA